MEKRGGALVRSIFVLQTRDTIFSAKTRARGEPREARTSSRYHVEIRNTERMTNRKDYTPDLAKKDLRLIREDSYDWSRIGDSIREETEKKKEKEKERTKKGVEKKKKKNVIIRGMFDVKYAENSRISKYKMSKKFKSLKASSQ